MYGTILKGDNMKKKSIDILKLKNGDTIQFHTKGFWNVFSKGIRFLTKSYWNHVGMIRINPTNTPDILDSYYVVEALGKGVVINPLTDYLSNPTYELKITRIKNTLPNYSRRINRAISRMKNYEGVEYDWWTVGFLGLKYIFKGWWQRGFEKLPKDVNLLQSREKLFCSEALCQAWYNTKAKIKNVFAGKHYPNAKCDTTTPKDTGKTTWVEFVDSTLKNGEDLL